MWRAIRSFLSGDFRPVPDASSARGAAIALVMSDPDRKILTCISASERLPLHIVNSRVEAWDAMNRLRSPVIFYDRDWPDAEWKTSVQAFAGSPQRPCVILISRVADDHLLQELIRCGGYELLVKPLRAEDAARAWRMAFHYWENARAPVKG